MENYPSNSQKAKSAENKPEREKLKKIVEGPVIRRKTPLGRQFKDTFFRADMKGVVGYVVADILIPKAKEAIVDSISQGAERTLYGEVKRALAPKQGGNSQYTSYSRFAGPPVQQPEPRRSLTQRAQANHDFGEIIIATRAEAQMIIDELFELVTSEYQQASVADLYEMLGITSDFTDNKYGWTDLRAAQIRQVRGGYLLDLPRPIVLD